MTTGAKPEDSRPDGQSVDGMGKLTTVQRWLAALVALLCGGVGVLAIFTTDNEGATTALVTGAMIVMVIAVSGQLPLRGSIGGVSWDLTRRLIQDDDPQVAARASQVALQAAETQRVPSDIVESAHMRLERVALDYERDVLEALTRIAALDGPERVSPGVPRAADAVFESGGKRVAVEIKAVPKAGESSPRILQHIARSGLSVDSVIVVTPTVTAVPGEYVSVSEEGSVTLSVVRWQGPEDDDLLHAALRRALSG